MCALAVDCYLFAYGGTARRPMCRWPMSKTPPAEAHGSSHRHPNHLQETSVEGKAHAPLWGRARTGARRRVGGARRVRLPARG